MTIVVGLADRGSIWFGADSRAEDDCSGRILAQPKIWRSRDYLIGISGSIRASNIIKHTVTLPPAPERSHHRHVVLTIVPAIREALRAAGYRTRTRSGSGGEDSDADILIGFRGRVFVIDGEFQAQRAIGGFDAIGSGAGPALGALHATPTLPPRARVLRALEAAELYGVGCRRPWKVLSDAALKRPSK